MDNIDGLRKHFLLDSSDSLAKQRLDLALSRSNFCLCCEKVKDPHHECCIGKLRSMKFQTKERILFAAKFGRELIRLKKIPCYFNNIRRPLPTDCQHNGKKILWNHSFESRDDSYGDGVISSVYGGFNFYYEYICFFLIEDDDESWSRTEMLDMIYQNNVPSNIVMLSYYGQSVPTVARIMSPISPSVYNFVHRWIMNESLEKKCNKNRTILNYGTHEYSLKNGVRGGRIFDSGLYVAGEKRNIMRHSALMVLLEEKLDAIRGSSTEDYSPYNFYKAKCLLHSREIDKARRLVDEAFVADLFASQSRLPEKPKCYGTDSQYLLEENHVDLALSALSTRSSISPRKLCRDDMNIVCSSLRRFALFETIHPHCLDFLFKELDMIFNSVPIDDMGAVSMSFVLDAASSICQIDDHRSSDILDMIKNVVERYTPDLEQGSVDKKDKLKILEFCMNIHQNRMEEKKNEENKGQ